MKRAFLLMLVCMVCAGLFAGGQQGSTSSGGLTTIKVWGRNKRYELSTGTLTLEDWYTGKVKSRIWDKLVEDLAKRGIKLDMTLIMGDQIRTAFQTLVASRQINNYDYIAPNGVEESTLLNLVMNQKLLLPLDTAIEQYSDGMARDFFLKDPAGQMIRKMNTMSDGHMYWLAYSETFYYKNPNNPVYQPGTGFIRYDWLKKLNLSTPTTMDQLFNTLKAFQDRDVNANGKKDEIALIDVSAEQFDRGFSGYFGISNGSLVYAQGGKALSQWYHPRAKDYVVWCKRLYDAGLLKLSFENNEFPQNIVGFYFQRPEWTYDPLVIVPPGEPKAYYAPLMIQAFPDTPALMNASPPAGSYPSGATYSIPASSKNVEKVVKMMDYFLTQEYLNLGWFGIEGYTFNTKPDGSRERIMPNQNNVGIDMHLTSGGDFAPFTGWAGIFPYTNMGDLSYNLQLMIEMGRNMGYPEGYTLRRDFLVDFWENNRWPYYLDIDQLNVVLAFPTAAELQRMSQFEDLGTYSAELMTSLIIGDKSLDNWNSYMADLKRLGLDELLAIYQARMDRAK